MRASEALGLGIIVFVASGIGAGVATRYWPAGPSMPSSSESSTHRAKPRDTDAVIFIDDKDCAAAAPVKNAVSYAFSGHTITFRVRSKCAAFNSALAPVSIQFVGTVPPLAQGSCTGGCGGKLDGNGVLDLPITFKPRAGGTYTYTITIGTTTLADPILEIDP